MHMVLKIVLVMMLAPLSVHAASLTADQLRMVEQLSPQDKASLAKQYGVDLPSSSHKMSITAPTTVKARPVGSSVIEADMKATTDEKLINADIGSSVKADLPIEKAGGQAGSDTIELKRAFSDFVRESKPLQVNTKNLKQFGYALFAGVPSTFAPATDVPVPAEYVLGPGDELEIQLYGQKSSVFTLVVDREGMVAFPEIGPLMLAGMSFAEAKATIAQQVGDKMVGVSASVSMGKLRSIRIFALGEVERPGSYTVSGLATLSHALFVSGGVKKIGSLRNVQLKRQGNIMVTLDLYDFLLKGDTSKDMRLLPGDVVFVPPIGKTASIAGEVVRPAIYEFKGRVDVAALIKLSGGLLPKAFRDEALLERINTKGNQEVKSLTLSDKGLKTRVQDGDVIKVFSTSDFEENPVLLIGNVKRPGKYAWKKGMLLKDLIKNEQELLPETFMDYGLIEREAKGNREPELLRFDVKNIFDKSSDRVALHPRDKVFVFHRSHFRMAPKAQVIGSVKSPGEYALKKNMYMLDLLLAAGGVTRDTYLEEAELYRTDSKSKEVVVSRFSVADVLQEKPEANILLQDLDKVVVHSIWEQKYRHFVTIQGEVKKAGKLPLASGMRLADLVFASGGVTRDVLMEDVQIYRTNEETKEVSLQVVSLPAALAGDEAHNIVLHDLDRVVVHSIWEQKYRHFVTIQGEVKKAGKLPLASGMRLADLIFASGGVTRDVLMEDVQIYRTNEETKEVSLQVVSLPAALAGDEAHNIVLHDLDRVVVHSIWERVQKYHVQVSGEVKKPGQYVFAEKGMRLADLVYAAGGITERALLENAELTRFVIIDGNKRESSHFDVDLEKALAGDEEANIELQPYDVVTVRQVSNWRAAEHVVLNGEVTYPGSYPIEDGEKLSNLIKRSGGFTDKAYLKAAVFTRESIRAEQQAQINEMVSRMEVEIAQEEESIGSLNDAQIVKHKQKALLAAKRVLGQMKATKASGRLVIELQDITRLEGSEFNLTLRNGDKLHVPKQPDQVGVIGQVYNTIALLYRKRYDLDDYIDAAGGPTRMADEDRIYIVRANGFVDRAGSWGSTRIYPGDTIVIPEELDQFNLLDSTLDWSRVLMQVGVGLASMKTIGVF